MFIYLVVDVSGAAVTPERWLSTMREEIPPNCVAETETGLEQR